MKQEELAIDPENSRALIALLFESSNSYPGVPEDFHAVAEFRKIYVIPVKLKLHSH